MMRRQFTNATFHEFIQNFRSGLLKPFIGSLRNQKEVPNDGALDQNSTRKTAKVVVSSSFPRLVTHSKRDVLVMFFAPWCQHSQAMLPMLDELASVLSLEPNVDVLKMDLTANEAPSQFEIPLYPTLYLVPADSKQRIRYTLGPYIHQMVQFVAQHASQELIGFDRSGGPKKQPEEGATRQVDKERVDSVVRETISSFDVKTEL